MRIGALESALLKYEADFSDTRLFMGRILSTTLSSLIFFSVASLGTGIAFLIAIVSAFGCGLRADCVNQYIFVKIWNVPWLNWDVSADHAEALMMLMAMGFLYRFFLSVQTLLLEISPEKYRARAFDSSPFHSSQWRQTDDGFSGAPKP